MNSGIYGTVRAANINIDTDVEIFYKYRPSYSSSSDDFANGYKSLNPSECLVQSRYQTGDETSSSLLGVYELRLPLENFNTSGIYSVYIRPAEMRGIRLSDVSVLATYSDVRGIVINSDAIPGITDLTGYRVEYIDDNGNRMDEVRIITSCNYAEPILVTVADQYPKMTRWRLTDTSSSFMFCTVTPSTSNSFSPNAEPFIGTAGQEIILTNTKFNPLLLDIELVDHDISTLSNMLEGDQIRDRDNGLITTYDENKSIYQQYEYYTLKDSLNNPLYDIKRKKDIPDTSQEWTKIMTPNQD